MLQKLAMQKFGTWRKTLQKSTRGMGLSLVGLVLVAVLPVLLFGVGAAWLVVDQQKHAVEQEIASISRAMQVAVDRELFRQIALMQLLATDASLDSGNLVAFGERAARAVASTPDWRNVALIDSTSYAVVASVLPMAAEHLTTSSPAAIDEVVRTRQPMVAGLIVGQIVKAPVIQFRAPVIRSDKVVYVLTVLVDPGTFSGLFAAQQLAPSWTGAVLDKSMVLAGRSRDAQRFLGKRATPTLADRITASSTGMFTALNQEGATVYTAFSRSALTGWTVAIGVPAAEVDGPIQRIVWQGAAAAAVLMALALLLATLVGRTILRTRRAHEMALNRFNDLVARVPVGIYSYRMTPDGGHGFDFVSALFCSQVGATQAQIMKDPTTAFKCFHPEDLPALITANDTARKTLQPFYWEGRVPGPDGMCWLRMESTPDLQSNGDIVWNGTQHDITQRVRATEEIAMLVRRQQAILNNELVGIVTVRAGLIVWANPAYALMLGYAEGELVGTPTRQAYSSDAAHQAVSASAYAAISGGGIWRSRIAQVRKDGQEVWLDVSGKVLDADTGESLWIFVDVTTLRQSEAALRKLSVAIEQAPLSVVITDLDAKIEYVNPKFTEVSGYSAAEAIGQNPRILHSGLVGKDVYLELWKSLTEGRAWQGELLNRRKDGTTYWEETHVAPVKNSEGESTHYVAVKLNVTERVRAAEQVAALLREQKAILNNSLVGIVTVKERKVVWANLCFETMLGYGPGELAGSATRQNYVSDEDYQRFGDGAYAALAQGLVYRSRLLHVRKDGQQIWFDSSGVMLNLAPGESLWCFNDITRQVQAEAKLLASELHLKTIVENEPECIKVVDAQGLLLQMNPAGLEMVEADSESQVVGQPVLGVIAPEHRAAFAAMHRRVIAGEPMQLEFEVLGLKGGRRWLETHAVPMQEHGQTVQLAVTRDITMRKEMQDQVHQLAFYDSLTSLANRRLFNDRLAQALLAGRRSGGYCALLFLDLDNFKPLNDAHGHAAGDLLLIEVAERMKACVREVDTVARFGGDEFVVLLSELAPDRATSTAESARVAEKIRSALGQPYRLQLPTLGNMPSQTAEHHCTASIGVAVIDAQEATAEDALRRADQAMYDAKAHGRNQVCFSEVVLSNAFK